MELQKNMIEQYLLAHQQPSLKKISEDTQIQITRVFRILNGSKMKLSEYEIFHKKVKEKLGLESNLEKLAQDCFIHLNADSIREIESLMNRKMAVFKIKQELKVANTNQSIA